MVDLDSPHKKPYEPLLIGRYNPCKDSKTNGSQTKNFLANSELQSRRLEEDFVGKASGDPEDGLTEEKRTDPGTDISHCPAVKRQRIDSVSEDFHVASRAGDTCQINYSTCQMNSSDSFQKQALPRAFCVRNLDEKNTGKDARDQRSYTALSDRVVTVRCNNSEVRNDQQCSLQPHQRCEKEVQVLPGRQVICSVPCKMHSRKPPLNCK